MIYVFIYAYLIIQIQLLFSIEEKMAIGTHFIVQMETRLELIDKITVEMIFLIFHLEQIHMVKI